MGFLCNGQLRQDVDSKKKKSINKQLIRHYKEISTDISARTRGNVHSVVTSVIRRSRRRDHWKLISTRDISNRSGSDVHSVTSEMSLRVTCIAMLNSVIPENRGQQNSAGKWMTFRIRNEH